MLAKMMFYFITYQNARYSLCIYVSVVQGSGLKPPPYLLCAPDVYWLVFPVSIFCRLPSIKTA